MGGNRKYPVSMCISSHSDRISSMKIYEIFSVIISQFTSKEFHDSKIKISGRVIMESPFAHQMLKLKRLT